MMRHLVLGYGSLIESGCRSDSCDCGRVYPVEVQGFERSWCVLAKSFGMSVLGVGISEGSVPIAMSYVDVVITGCLEYGEDFAKRFSETTSRWDRQIVDDRSRPMYPRAKKDPDTEPIDRLLEDVLAIGI